LLSKNIKVTVYRIIILPVVLYGYETWLLRLRVKHKLKVFENRVLRRIFGTERGEVTGEWRSLMICTPGDHLEDPGVDGRIILRWIFREWNEGAWTGLIWLRIGTGGSNL
jgi:hypothetical protein